MLLNAAGIAALNAWASLHPRNGEVHISWITVLILVYSMIAPSSPRRMLLASLGAASMDPLAFTTVHLAGLPTAPFFVVLMMAWPNFACAVIAMLPSTVSVNVPVDETSEFVVRASELRFFDKETGLRTTAQRL